MKLLKILMNKKPHGLQNFWNLVVRLLYELKKDIDNPINAYLLNILYPLNIR